MLRYMLDSNLCIHVMRNPDSRAADKMKENAGALAISMITVHELFYGADKSRRPTYQRDLVMDFASKIEVLDFDAGAADHSGNIHATLAKVGAIIGAFDMLIAGHARSRGLIVVTNNLREFTRVEGLRCEDWL
jgi:tRNA(fMet)-specific endonuclease VapC